MRRQTAAPLFIAGLITADRPIAGAAAGDHRQRARGAEATPERVGIVSSIGDKPSKPTGRG